MKKKMMRIFAIVFAVAFFSIPVVQAPALSGVKVKPKAAAACGTPKPLRTAKPVKIVPSLEEISGTVEAVSGRYGIEVRDDGGITNDVELTSGTIVKPAGSQVRWGMRVRVVGRTLGCVFIAKEVVITSYP